MYSPRPVNEVTAVLVLEEKEKIGVHAKRSGIADEFVESACLLAYRDVGEHTSDWELSCQNGYVLGKSIRDCKCVASVYRYSKAE